MSRHTINSATLSGAPRPTPLRRTFSRGSVRRAATHRHVSPFSPLAGARTIQAFPSFYSVGSIGSPLHSRPSSLSLVDTSFEAKEPEPGERSLVFGGHHAEAGPTSVGAMKSLASWNMQEHQSPEYTPALLGTGLESAAAAADGWSLLMERKGRPIIGGVAARRPGSRDGFRVDVLGKHATLLDTVGTGLGRHSTHEQKHRPHSRDGRMVSRGHSSHDHDTTTAPNAGGGRPSTVRFIALDKESAGGAPQFSVLHGTGPDGQPAPFFALRARQPGARETPHAPLLRTSSTHNMVHSPSCPPRPSTAPAAAGDGSVTPIALLTQSASPTVGDTHETLRSHGQGQVRTSSQRWRVLAAAMGARMMLHRLQAIHAAHSMMDTLGATTEPHGAEQSTTIAIPGPPTTTQHVHFPPSPVKAGSIDAELPTSDHDQAPGNKPKSPAAWVRSCFFVSVGSSLMQLVHYRRVSGEFHWV